MTQSRTVVQFVRKPPHNLASVFPDSVPSCHLTSAVACGPARAASQSPTPNGLLELQIQRETLIAQASHARNMRQNKRASLIEAELRDVTHHIIYLGLAK
jgi:hypothetical protein